MTDGERLVWATTFSILIDRGTDGVAAAQAACRAVKQLNEAALRRKPDGNYAIEEIDERDYLDEIVSAP